MRTLLVLTLCLSTGALAITKGGPLYVRSNDTPLLKEPKAKSATLMKLARGTAVIWNGPSEKDKQWHEVMVAGKKGFVHLTELSPNRPQPEVDSASGKALSVEAFASSGAVIGCRFGSGRATSHSPASQLAEAELIYVEELNKAKVTPEALSAKEKELRAP